MKSPKVENIALCEWGGDNGYPPINQWFFTPKPEKSKYNKPLASNGKVVNNSIMTKYESPSEHIIDIIESYSTTPSDERNAEATVHKIMLLAGSDDSSLFSGLGFAVRAAASFNTPEIITAIGTAIPREKKRERHQVLERFCHHANPSWTEETYNTVFNNFRDVINEPSEVTGTNVIFHGMQAEISGKRGMLASMVRHGANPNLTFTHNNGPTTALDLAKNNMLEIYGQMPDKMQAANARKNEKWQRIIDIMADTSIQVGSVRLPAQTPKEYVAFARASDRLAECLADLIVAGVKKLPAETQGADPLAPKRTSDQSYEETFELSGNALAAWQQLATAKQAAQGIAEPKPEEVGGETNFWTIREKISQPLQATDSAPWHPVSALVSDKIVRFSDIQRLVKPNDKGETVTAVAGVDIKFRTEGNKVLADVSIMNPEILNSVYGLASRSR